MLQSLHFRACSAGSSSQPGLLSDSSFWDRSGRVMGHSARGLVYLVLSLLRLPLSGQNKLGQLAFKSHQSWDETWETCSRQTCPELFREIKTARHAAVVCARNRAQQVPVVWRLQELACGLAASERKCFTDHQPGCMLSEIV